MTVQAFTTAKKEILDILIKDLTEHDEFELEDKLLREQWINSKSMDYFIVNHWENDKNDSDINDLIYSLYSIYCEDIEYKLENKM